MSYDPNKPKSLDELEQKLYSPNQNITTQERKPMREKQYDIPSDWEHPVEPVDRNSFFQQDKGPNWFFRFFIVAFLFFLGAAIYAGYTYFFGGQTAIKNLDIAVTAPLSIPSGEPFEFEVLLTNRDNLPLTNGELTLQFPDGTRVSSDINQLQEKDTRIIERIDSGSTSKQNYSVLLFGEENENKNIQIFFTYSREDSSTPFGNEKNFEVILRSTPIRMVVNNVSETTSGQDVTFAIELSSNSTQSLKNIILEASFPFGFNLKSSSLPVREDKKSWVISELNPRQSTSFTITGSLDGLQGDEKFFRFVSGLETSNTEQPLAIFNARNTIISIKRPFLEIALDVNKNTDQIIDVIPSGINNATITFKNNATSPIRNTQIILGISGSGLLKESISVNEGFYQSNNNTIIWDYTNLKDLVNFPVGAVKRVNFTFSTLGIKQDFFVKNPELQFTISVKGNRNTDGNIIDTLQDTITRIIKINSEVFVSSASEYYSTIFSNVGPIPPKAESRTTYTSIIEIANSSNDLENGIVKISVPNYVQYTNLFSPTSENVTYDPVARIISWNIGNIPAFVGFRGVAPKRLYVQTSITPSISQIGQSPELLNNILFEARDSFTGSDIKREIPSIRTNIRDSKNPGGDTAVTR
jgi:hypothetical protein